MATGLHSSVWRKVAQRCSTVAIIGPDGAGKTAVAKRLLKECPAPLKYLYMGVSIESSNVALPTSRLLHAVKVFIYKRSLRKAHKPIPKTVSFHSGELRALGYARGTFAKTVRLLIRIAEQSYRQLFSWAYQLRGYVVLYDRHFLFDLIPSPSDRRRCSAADRAQHWLLKRVFPRPALVILLEASVDVIHERKTELDKERITAYYSSALEKQLYVDKFVRVDCAQPIEAVVTEVSDLILQNCVSRPAN